jgi:hypothetical protein
MTSALSQLEMGVAQTFLSVQEQTRMSVPPQNQGVTKLDGLSRTMREHPFFPPLRKGGWRIWLATNIQCHFWSTPETTKRC